LLLQPGDPHVRLSTAATIEANGFNLLPVEAGRADGALTRAVAMEVTTG
jgi:hypothetical protein